MAELSLLHANIEVDEEATFYHILQSRVQILDSDWLNSGHYDKTTSGIVHISKITPHITHPGTLFTYRRF